MFILSQTLLTVLLPTSHLVQQKATQEYTKICVWAEIWGYPWHCILELKYYFPTNHIKTEDLKKQHGREREMTSYCIKRTHEGAYRHKKRRCHIRKENTVQKVGNEFWGKLEKGNWGTKILFQEVFGEAQLKLCSCEEAATTAPSCLLELSSEDQQRKHTQESLLSGPQSATQHRHYPEASDTSPLGLRSLDFPGRRFP